jgi:hypothetical protein
VSFRRELLPKNINTAQPLILYNNTIEGGYFLHIRKTHSVFCIFAKDLQELNPLKTRGYELAWELHLHKQERKRRIRK